MGVVEFKASALGKAQRAQQIMRTCWARHSRSFAQPAFLRIGRITAEYQQSGI